MKKVLIIYPYHHHYRTDFFNSLSNKFDLTVLHSGFTSFEEKHSNIKFKEIIITKYKIGPFIVRPSLFKFTEGYDYYIILSDLRWISSILFFLFNYKKHKLILWGNWFTNSKISNQLRVMLAKKAFSNIFYHQKTKNEFVKSGIKKNICFVANNTIHVDQNLSDFNEKRNKILVVGSLNSRKRINLLIMSFIKIHKLIPHVTLDIIGSGDQMEYLKGIANLNENIIFHGRIENKQILSKFYNKAICEVSPMQAGLSVLQSLGFGVPFITHKHAITGGEIYNIIDGFNGFLFDSHKKNLSDIILNLCNNKKLIIEMSKNSKIYYNSFCTNENMVNGFIDSINLSNTTKIDLSNY